MSTAMLDRPLTERALDLFQQAGNPFRNYFARNPDDAVCAQFHVPELFAKERAQLLGVVELYRQTPTLHSEMIPVLGNKGAGKTHLLHSIKHGSDGSWQLLVTPGTFQKDTDFLEYLLFQVIDTLLGGGKQKGRRPLDFVCEQLTRQVLRDTIAGATRDELLDLFPAPGLGRWTRRLGIGATQAQERAQWLTDCLRLPPTMPLRQMLTENATDGDKACELIGTVVDRTQPHSTEGVMKRALYQGFARAAILGDESDIANFLTYGFAELDFKVEPSRNALVLNLFKTLMQVFQELRIPVVVAFDQLEDLLLARRNDDGHKTAEAFFAGIVQTMHNVPGICFLVFAERGLWNRFVPSLDGYIQDRLNNPVHVPGFGTIKSLRLEAPSAELVVKVVESRLLPLLSAVNDPSLASIHPFTMDKVQQIAKTEPTLRDMLQQFRHLFDHVVYGEVQTTSYETEEAKPISRLPKPPQEPKIKSVVIVETEPQVKVTTLPPPRQPIATGDTTSLSSIWETELAAARGRLATESALTGATRELQAALGAFLQTCLEHGVKVGPWRLQHAVPEFSFGEHPTYGMISIGHWVCKDGQPWKVGIGLFLARGAGKPKDLETKLAALDAEPAVIDHLILLRPDDDANLTGKSKTVWQDAEKRGKHARLEAVSLENFTLLSSFPRWLAAAGESLPSGQPLPNVADLMQDRCEKLLEQICMPCP